MGVSFLVHGYDTESTNIISTNGVTLYGSSARIYTFYIRNADKGYSLPGARISYAVEKYQDGVWTIESSDLKYASGGGLLSVVFTNAISDIPYRVRIISTTTENGNTLTQLESLLENPSDGSLSNYRKIKPKVTHIGFDTAGQEINNSVFFEDETKIVYLLKPLVRTGTVTFYNYSFSPKIKYTFVKEDLSEILLPFVEIPTFKKQTQAQYDSGVYSEEFLTPIGMESGAGGSANSTSKTDYDGNRTTNNWTTYGDTDSPYDLEGYVYPTYQTPDATTNPGNIYITFFKDDVYIPRTDNYLNKTPSQIIFEQNVFSTKMNSVFSLPTSCSIKYSNDAVESEKTITWDKNVDTSSVGSFVYTASYTENGTTITQAVTLNVTKTLVEIYFVNNSQNIFYNENYNLPLKATAKYSDNSISEVDVTFDKIINNKIVGLTQYTATYTEDFISKNCVFNVTVLLRPTSIEINKESVYINENTIFDTNELIFKVIFEDGSETNKTFEDVIIDKPIDLNAEGDTEYIFSYTENTVTVSDSLIFKIDKTDPTFTILKIENITINSSDLLIKTNEPNCVFYFKISEENVQPSLEEIKNNIETNIEITSINEFEKNIKFKNLKSKKEYFIFVLAADSNGNTQDSISYLSFKTLPIPFVLNGGVFLGTKNIIIEQSENFDEIHYRIEDVKISQVTNNKDSYDVAYSENNVVQNKLLSSDFLLYNETIEITAPNNLSKTIVLAIQLYKNNEPVSYIVLSEFSVISNTQTVESIFSDYVKVSNKEVIRTFIDTNIEENKKYFYKVISVKQKFVTK